MLYSTTLLQLLLLLSVCSVYAAPATPENGSLSSSNNPGSQKRPSTGTAPTTPKDKSSSSSEKSGEQRQPTGTNTDDKSTSGSSSASGDTTTAKKKWDFPYILISPSTNRSPRGGDIQDRVTWAPDKKQFVMYVKIGDASWNEETGEVKDDDDANNGGSGDNPTNDPKDSTNKSDDSKGEPDDPKGDSESQPDDSSSGASKSNSRPKKNDKKKDTQTPSTHIKRAPKKQGPSSSSTREANYVTHNPAFIYTASDKTKVPYTTKTNSRPGKKLQNEVFKGYNIEDASKTTGQAKIFQVPSLRKVSEWYELMLGDDIKEAVNCAVYVREKMWKSFTTTDFSDDNSQERKKWVENAKETLKMATSGKCTTSGSGDSDPPADKPTKGKDQKAS